MTNELHEECGVFGIWSDITTDVASMTYYGLYALQHRGQESCGIVVNDDGVFHSVREVGRVNDVFHDNEIKSLGQGNIAVGHVRYGTTGSDAATNIQPIVVNHRKGHLALAHNGNLVNAYELRNTLEESGAIFHTTSDTEVISYVIIQERLINDSIEEAVDAAMDKLAGAYSIVLMSPAKLIAARDPHGFRPLCFGRTECGEIVFASETCALDAVGASYERDVRPGEVIVVTRDGMTSITNHCNLVERSLCIFEYIYFARPDSLIDGESVHLARQRAGAFLALEHPVQADIVIGVPDSGLDAGLGYAKQSGIPYGIGFIKNKYIGRTFISPTQQMREHEVRIKLNPVAAVVSGKRVVLIDDSIVRGTTSRRIIRLLREAGATEVHVRVSAPPFRHACYYGTDIDNEEVLLATNRTLKEMAEYIGADSLGFLSVQDAQKLPECTHNGFCTACFDGSYPTAIPAISQKKRFDEKISEVKKNA